MNKWQIALAMVLVIGFSVVQFQCSKYYVEMEKIKYKYTKRVCIEMKQDQPVETKAP